jgi:hypothetical protein
MGADYLETSAITDFTSYSKASEDQTLKNGALLVYTSLILYREQWICKFPVKDETNSVS